MNLNIDLNVNHVHLPYWDVLPKELRVSLSDPPGVIPLSIRGEVTAPICESSNPHVVTVDADAKLHIGTNAGNAMISVWASGEKKSLRHVAVEVRDPVWFETHPDFTVKVVHHVVGLVMDAVTTLGIPGATVILRRSQSGPATQTLTCDENGSYETNLTEGVYYYEASASGYLTASGIISVYAAGVSGQNIPLSPELVGQIARIVLQWGETPSDLDSHLWGPKANGERFHVSYMQQEEANCATLDVDDTSSYGPETVTLISLNPGTYRYLIHDYTNRDVNPSTALATSGATVKVYLQSGQQQTFTVPSQAGTVWHVFDMDGSNGVITPVNAMSHESDPNNVGS